MSTDQQTDAAGNRSVVLPNWLLRALEALTATTIFIMMLLIVIDVVTRYFFNHPLRGVYEITGLLLGCMAMSALPLATEQRGHITVDLIDGFLHGPVRFAIQLVILVFQFVVIGFISYRIYAMAVREWQSGWVTVDLQISRVPILYAMSALGALTTLIVAVMVVQFLRGRLAVVPVDGQRNDDQLN